MNKTRELQDSLKNMPSSNLEVRNISNVVDSMADTSRRALEELSQFDDQVNKFENDYEKLIEEMNEFTESLRDASMNSMNKIMQVCVFLCCIVLCFHIVMYR